MRCHATLMMPRAAADDIRQLIFPLLASRYIIIAADAATLMLTRAMP